MDMNELIKAAIDFEDKGRSAYLEAAGRTRSNVMKQTWEFLAKEELKHKEAILSYIEEHKLSFSPGEVDPEAFFDSTIEEFKEDVQLTKSDEEAYKLACELEKESYDYYKGLLDEADGEAKKLLTMLKDAEAKHYELINKSYWYVKDPEGFYAKEEKWFIEGG